MSQRCADSVASTTLHTNLRACLCHQQNDTKSLPSLDLVIGTVIDQVQLDESLQQQQTVMQQMLDVLNEKIENWVCQCFSDLRNRIIELVSSSGMLHDSCYAIICAS